MYGVRHSSKAGYALNAHQRREGGLALELFACGRFVRRQALPAAFRLRGPSTAPNNARVSTSTETRQSSIFSGVPGECVFTYVREPTITFHVLQV
jgi:hypothetical protein